MLFGAGIGLAGPRFFLDCIRRRGWMRAVEDGTDG
jgi:hypothetical protein